MLPFCKGEYNTGEVRMENSVTTLCFEVLSLQVWLRWLL